MMNMLASYMQTKISVSLALLSHQTCYSKTLQFPFHT